MAPISVPGKLFVLHEWSVDNISYDLFAYCDAHDLLAIADDRLARDITVYRLRGDVAFTIKPHNNGCESNSISWKSDGSMLAWGCSCQATSIHSGEDGRQLHRMPAKAQLIEADWKFDVEPIGDPKKDLQRIAEPVEDLLHEDKDTHFANIVRWSTYTPRLADVGNVQMDARIWNTEQWYDGRLGGTAGSASQPADPSSCRTLAGAITMLDTTKVMPRLSKIDMPKDMKSTIDSAKFSTQATTDEIFEGTPLDREIISTFMVSHASGWTEVFLDENIKIGEANCLFMSQMHAFHPECETQVMMSENTNGLEGFHRWHLEYFDLPLGTLRSPAHRLYTVETKRVQELLPYITHTIRCIHHEFEVGNKYPDRLLANLLEDSYTPQGDDGGMADTNRMLGDLAQLCITGDFTEELLEWLKDMVKETGHKRWDLAVNTMHARIQDLLYKNLLPALDRLCIATSTLRGRARYQVDHPRSHRFPVDPRAFDDLEDAADALRLAAERILALVMEEHKAFRSFSKWLRVQIDIAVAGYGTRSANEIGEREMPNVDTDACLTYIIEALHRKRLRDHLKPVPFEDMKLYNQQDFFAHSVIEQLTRACTKEAVRRDRASFEDQVNEHRDESNIALNLTLLTAVLNARTRVAIQNIASWQSKTMPERETIPIPDEHFPRGVLALQDLRLLPALSDDENAREYVQILCQSPDSSGRRYQVIVVQVARQKDREKEEVIKNWRLFVLPDEVDVESAARSGQLIPEDHARDVDLDSSKGHVIHARFEGSRHILVLYQPGKVSHPLSPICTNQHSPNH